jgi:hypothetical protein
MQDPTPECWLPVVGYESSYVVSDRGRVKSISRIVPFGRGTRCVPSVVLKPTLNNRGRLVVGLSVNGCVKLFLVHRLVLRAFKGPCPLGMEGCHNDGDAANNALENLRWDTHLENIRDQARHGTNSRSNRTRCRREHLLIAPNLVPSMQAKGRSCLACNRVSLPVDHPDFKAVADLNYAKIMSGVAPVIPAGPKLSIEQIAQVRERYALGGLRQVDLASAYGVSQSVVSRAVRGAYGA